MIAEPILNRLAARLGRALAPPADPLVGLRVEGHVAGLLDTARARRVAAFADVFESCDDGLRFVAGLDTPQRRTAAMEAVVRALADEGRLTAWRNERYAVRADDDYGAVLFEMERAAARYFGIATFAAHITGIVEFDGRPRMWIARRSVRKAIDPGMLDNLVGGGIAAGETVAATLVREAQEEAGIPADVAVQARRAAPLCIFRRQPDGLHRETIFPHDLALPIDFRPRNDDGEIAEFRLVTIDDAARFAGTDEGADAMTADASLVVADWLLRNGHVPRATGAWTALDALRRATPESIARSRNR